MNNLPQYFVVYCEQREGYLMDNGFFSHNVEAAKIFHKGVLRWNPRFFCDPVTAGVVTQTTG